MKTRSKLAIATAISVALSVATWGTAMAAAPDFDATTLTGNWGGLRTTLYNDGVDINFGILGQSAYLASGGGRNVGQLNDQFTLAVDFDLGKLIGWQGASLHFMGTNRNGQTLDTKAGMLEFVQANANVGGGFRGRMNEGYLQQELWGGKVGIKVGYMDAGPAGAGFMDAVGCDTMNLTFCYSPLAWTSIIDFGDTIFPAQRLGAVVTVRPSSQLYFKVGTLRTNQLGVAHPGMMTLAEFGWTADVNGLPGTWAIGGWQDTASFDTNSIFGINNPYLATNPGGNPVVRGSRGFYVDFNQQVTKNAANGGLSFVGFGVFPSDDSSAMLDQSLGIGAVYKAPFPSRPNDQVDLFVGRAHLNSRIGNGQRILMSQGLSVLGYGPIGAFSDIIAPQTGYQYTMELNYNAQIFRGVTLMPNVQYIANPGGTSKNKNDTVIGLQLAIAL